MRELGRTPNGEGAAVALHHGVAVGGRGPGPGALAAGVAPRVVAVCRPYVIRPAGRRFGGFRCATRMKSSQPEWCRTSPSDRKPILLGHRDRSGLLLRLQLVRPRPALATALTAAGPARGWIVHLFHATTCNWVQPGATECDLLRPTRNVVRCVSTPSSESCASPTTPLRKAVVAGSSPAAGSNTTCCRSRT